MRSISTSASGLVGIGGQNLAPRRERVRARLELVLLELGHAGQQPRRLRARGRQRFAAHLEHGHEPGPGGARFVERLEHARDPLAVLWRGQELLEQAPRALVARGRAHDLLEEIERAVDVAEARGAQIGAPELELGDLGGRREAAPRAEQLLEIAPALGRGVVPIERAMGPHVRRIELEHLLVGRDGVRRVRERTLVDLRDLGQQIQALARVERRPLTRVEQGPQLGPALTRAEEARASALNAPAFSGSLARIST